ncbi:LysE family translocator [Citreimonas sp.]|uniref:LysE family translocator n=1 Tax=Citreimonas sp. TaxID=3036715 RepID=UPI0035C7BF29
MGVEAWAVFAGFWVVFVTSPGPNAVNCIRNGMTFGFARALWGVAAILTQAALFLALSAAGVTALIKASETGFLAAQIAGAAVLLWLGVRTWRRADRPLAAEAAAPARIYGHAFMVATINPKSVAGYLAAFSQFVSPHVPIGQQMWTIVPTALVITFASYAGYTALGTALGRAALSAVANVAVRKGLAACFVLYGVALAVAALRGLS